MGLSGVVRPAVLLTWSLLFLASVQGWRWITEEEANDIRAGLFSPSDNKPFLVQPGIDEGPTETPTTETPTTETPTTETPTTETPTTETPTTENPTTPPSVRKQEQIDSDSDYDYYDVDPEEPLEEKNAENMNWKSTFTRPKFSTTSYPDPYNYDDGDEEDGQDEKEDPTGFHFVCSRKSFKIFLNEKELDGVKVIHSKDVLSFMDGPKSCGSMDRNKGTLTVPFTGGCFATNENNVYSLQLLLAGGTQVRTATCFGPKTGQNSQSQKSPRTNTGSALSCLSEAENSSIATQGGGSLNAGPMGSLAGSLTLSGAGTETGTRNRIESFSLPSNGCSSTPEERIDCGGSNANDEEACDRLGCCWDLFTQACFYPENECTEDGFFVFTIRSNSGPLPVNPRTLTIPGTNCRALQDSDTYAVFKLHRDSCGIRSFVVGEAIIYLAEVETTQNTLNLRYGAISRDQQVKFLIECRYTSDNASSTSAGFMVTTPTITVPSSISFNGLYGILLRIAKDEAYSDFYPTYHPPLGMILGQKVFLQLLLLSPVPNATIVVNYCLAYPRFARKALVLLFEGCGNKNDQRVFVLRNSDFQGEKNERRFSVDAFQFMNQTTKQYIDEDIYFMCSTYLCLWDEKCVKQCADA